MARKRRGKPEPSADTGAAAVAPDAGGSAAPAAAAAPGRRGLWVATALLLLAALGFGVWQVRDVGRSAAAPAQATAATAAAPAALAPALPSSATYIDNAQCLGCHQDAANAWKQSHHAKAMAAPNEHTVRGNFDNTQFRHQGVSTRFFKRGDKFFVNTDGPDGRQGDFEIKYTFGHEPLQQYLIETQGGRLQPLQIAWNTREKKWFHLLPNEKAPPGDVLHWSGRYQTGNTMCISCHTTGFEKRFDAQADAFASRWSEVNVSCQSCHGPGSRHAEWALGRAADPSRAAPAAERHGLLADLKTPKSQVEVCSACHSRRAELTATPVPGQPHLDHYLPSLLREGLYHADGQQLDEVFVGGSFRQSKMYRMGVSCTDCHNPHSAKPKLQGNALCLQCHQPQANPAFPSATGSFDTPQHHRHEAGTPGAQCVACHMPAKNYMVVQPRPDHSMRVPRPDLTVSIGTPNACNQCHADKPAQWAADAVTRWYGAPKRPAHYGEVFAAARRGAAGSAQALASIAADAAQPPIVRATALDMLRGNPTAGIGERIEATRDVDAEVRAAAASSLDGLEASQRVPALAPLLKDPLRAVRIAAARSLASLPAGQFDAPTRAAYDAALAEYIAAQSVALDMPGN
ncbi:MAG TPA: cytochrome c3 family protein, partial [Rubrivivax sp.]|nr:cytochrome c3 family protein [Rubrivivax sp.]